MRIISIFVLILSLMACQQAEDDSQTPKAQEKSKVTKMPEASSTPTSKQSTPEVQSTAKKDFSPLTELPYETVESDEVCSAPVVIEFFAYQCPHCYTLEKFAAAWKKNNAGKIQFRSIPTDLGNKSFGSFLIVHHAAEKLGLLESAIPALFERLHEQNKGFSSLEDAVSFLVLLGASEQEAKQVIGDQEAVKKAVEEDFRLLAKYKISGVPTVLVNHRYQFSVTKAGGYEKVFEVVDETLRLPSGCSEK